MPPKRKETHPVSSPPVGLKTPSHEPGAKFVWLTGEISYGERAE